MTTDNKNIKHQEQAAKGSEIAEKAPSAQSKKEIGGPAGLEPTRYGDWEKNGRCSDF